METPIKRQVPNEPTQRLPAWVTDLLLGLALTCIIIIVISADQGGTEEADWLAYAIAVGFGALMLVRRTAPLFVLVATMLLLFGYYILPYPAIGLAVPVSAALFSAAELGRVRAAIVVSLLLITVSTYFRIREGQDIAYLLGYELISTVTLMAAAIALGDSLRARRSLRAEQAQRAQLLEQEHNLRTEQRIQAERMRMARDLHDTLGHAISVISLHADVAREAIGHNDAEARQALAQIRSTTSATMRELRATVKLLRNASTEQAERSVASLANLSLLVENAQASGLTVHLENQCVSGQLPNTVDTAAYRIIQESLTNVIRHAQASEVTIVLQVKEARLHLSILDNGTADSKASEAGSGIVGMNERGRLLGGTLTAQSCPAGGFRVYTEIPLENGQ